MLRRDTMRPLLFTFLVAVNEANSRDWIFGVTIEVRGEKEGEIEIVIEREREKQGYTIRRVPSGRILLSHELRRSS